MLGISRSTIYRWDSEDDQRFGAIPRSTTGYRRFSAEQLTFVLRGLVNRAYGGSKTGVVPQAVNEAGVLVKLMVGDRIGIVELESMTGVRPVAVLWLLKIAVRHYQPGDEMFAEILRVAHLHCLGLAEQKGNADGSASN